MPYIRALRMTILDKGLGIELVELKDLLDSVPSETDLEGITVQPCVQRARIRRFDNSNSPMREWGAGLNKIDFWVVLDCGEKESRWYNPDSIRPYERAIRNDRYIAIAISTEEWIEDVDFEERGTALPGRYSSLDEAGAVSAELNSVCRLMEQ